MRYVCLIYDDEKNWEKMPKPDADAMMGEYFAFTDDIKTSGHYSAAKRCSRCSTATTVRVRNGKTLDDRRPVRRDEGAARRLLPHRGEGPERGDPDRGTHPVGAHRAASRCGRSWTS